MAHNGYIRAGAIWVTGTTVLGSEWNKFDVAQFKSINGDDGGTWNPATPIVIGGQGINPIIAGGVPPLYLASAQPTRDVMSSLASPFKTSNFAPTSQGWQQASATGGSFSCVLREVHDAATLSKVTLTWKVVGPHTGVPGTLPKLSIARVNLSTGAVGQTLNSGDAGAGLAIAAPGTGAAWDDGGATQSFDYTCDQNNVIDHTAYAYLLILADETGVNSVSGNTYFGAKMHFTAIPDMRAP